MKNNYNDKKSVVRLKGVGKSLWVTFDPSVQLNILQNEISKLFKQSNYLPVNSQVVLDPEGKVENEKLVEKLSEFLKQSFFVKSVTTPPLKYPKVVGKENIGYKKKDVTSDSVMRKYSSVLMLAGRVRSGQQVVSEKHLVILGDVNPGAEVVACGDILVIGSLCGKACAGKPNNKKSIVFALDFRPTQVQIGGIVAAGIPRSSREKVEFAFVENDTIIVQDYIKANPFSRLTWPEVR